MSPKMIININTPSNLKEFVRDPDFRVKIKNDADRPELLILDPIGEDMFGEGVSEKTVVEFLNQHSGEDIRVRINSPGGSVFAGLQIYNGLASHNGHVEAVIEGLAFSAASFIAQAADTIKMHEASDFGIHRASGFAIGNSKTLLGVVEWLDTIDEHLVEIYHARTSQPRAQIEQWMDGIDDGTLFSAKDAVQYGFADELIPLKVPAKPAAAAPLVPHNRVAAEYRLKLMKASR